MLPRTFLDALRPTLVGQDIASAEKKWAMLDKVSRVEPSVAVLVTILVVAWIERDGGVYSYAQLWLASAAALVLARIGLRRAFLARSEQASAETWTLIWSAVMVFTGIQWGVGGFVLADAKHLATGNVVMAVMAAFLTAAAMRLYVIQKAMAGLIIACFGIASIGLMLGGRWELVVLQGMGTCYSLVFTHSLAKLEAGRLAGEVEKARLLETLAESNAALATANAQLETLALTDALTQLPNRRAFDRALDAAARRAGREAVPMAVLLMDIDHFKRFNDTYGHQAGDQCLALVGKAMKSAVSRSGDFIARYGGEEFAAILPGTDTAQAAIVADRIRLSIEAIDLSSSPGHHLGVTLSIGLATGVPSPELAATDLIERADEALYRAKKDGRNCLRIAEARGEPTLEHATAA